MAELYNSLETCQNMPYVSNSGGEPYSQLKFAFLALQSCLFGCFSELVRGRQIEHNGFVSGVVLLCASGSIHVQGHLRTGTVGSKIDTPNHAHTYHTYRERERVIYIYIYIVI